MSLLRHSLLLSILLASPAAAQNLDSLLARMTLEEKLGQLNLLSAGGRASPAQMQLAREGKLGGLFNVIGAENTTPVQRIAVTESRLKIPLLFGLDVIHGYRTIFRFHSGRRARSIPTPPKRPRGPRARKPPPSGSTGPTRPWWTSRAIHAGAGSRKVRARIRTWARCWRPPASADFSRRSSRRPSISPATAPPKRGGAGSWRASTWTCRAASTWTRLPPWCAAIGFHCGSWTPP